MTPADWPVEARKIRVDRAGGRCECNGDCNIETHDMPRCSRPAVSTLALDGNTQNTDGSNLLAVCLECRLSREKLTGPLAVGAEKNLRTSATSAEIDIPPEWWDR